MYNVEEEEEMPEVGEEFPEEEEDMLNAERMPLDMMLEERQLSGPRYISLLL